MNRAWKFGAWTAMAIGCGFNGPTPPVEKPEPQIGFVFDGEAVSAKVAPAAISGGTLLVTANKRFAYVASPEANVVDVIDIEAREKKFTFELGDGVEPGRMAEDRGKVHVVLRRGGAIATLDYATKTIVKTPVCEVPRGITAKDGVIRVACQSGELVTISESGTTTSQAVDADLRDVIVRADGTMSVSRFRSAELLDLDAEGKVVGRTAPMNALNRIQDPRKPNEVINARYQADVAWRSAPAPDGSVYVLHQYATTRSIAIKPEPNQGGGGAPYGGGGFDPCGNSKLVVPALTRIAPGETPRTMRLGFDAPGFDMAISATTGRVAVAGATGVSTFTPDFPTTADEVGTDCNNSQRSPEGSIPTGGQAIAVAFGAADVVLVQTRDPATLVISNSGVGVSGSVSLTSSSHDTGFKVFHTPTQAGIACVSCHPEGGDDGHTWTFAELGARRTQSLRGGIMQTAPFHWGGDMANVSQLAHDVFTDRMGGGQLSEPQVGVLASWIDRQPALATLQRAPDAVQRGQALFASSGCTTCHSGAHLTNNQNADVGTGGALQVPSLVGVSARAPFMHDGCAPTLMDRFTNTACGGGTKHGNTANLTQPELADLVSYLETL